jgi:uncharacterized protein YacL
MPSKSIRSNSSLSNINTPVIDKYSPVVGFAIVTQILTLIIITFILNWLNKIKSCKCTNIPERNFLPEWFSFFTIWIIISLAMFIAYNANSSEYPVIFTILNIIVTIINLVMIIRLFIYIRKLKEMNCDCGLSQEENIIYYYVIIGFAFIAFAMLMGIIGMVISLSS